MKPRLPSFVWKKDKVLETKVSVLQGEMRQLKWALFGSFGECARLRAALAQHGIEVPRGERRSDWSRVEARELFDLAWKYLWSSQALYIDVRAIAVIELDDLKCSNEGFRISLTHVPVPGLSVPKRARWNETASWEQFNCTAWSWTSAFGGWTLDFDPRSIQAARAAAKGLPDLPEGREKVKEIKQLMAEWRLIIAEKTIITDDAEIEI